MPSSTRDSTQHWLPESELDRVMETYDKNGNGLIEFEEFQSIVSAGRMTLFLNTSPMH